MSFLIGILLAILGGMGLTGGYDAAITFHINSVDLSITPGWTLFLGIILALS